MTGWLPFDDLVRVEEEGHLTLRGLGRIRAVDEVVGARDPEVTADRATVGVAADTLIQYIQIYLDHTRSSVVRSATPGGDTADRLSQPLHIPPH